MFAQARTEKSNSLSSHNWVSQATERKVYILRLCHPPGARDHPALSYDEFGDVYTSEYSLRVVILCEWNVGPPYVISLRVDGTWACPTLYSSLFYSMLMERGPTLRCVDVLLTVDGTWVHPTLFHSLFHSL